MLNAAEVYTEFFKTFREVSGPNEQFEVTGRPNGFAASLEALLGFKAAVLARPSGRILDAGSGVSSALLRLWFPPHVTTCDSDPAYMALVKETCARLADKFQAPELALDSYVTGYFDQPVDATFYDYGNFDQRIEFLPQVLEHTRHLIYLDDVDHRERGAQVRGAVYWHARTKGWSLTDRPDLVDEYGRWGVMATRI